MNRKQKRADGSLIPLDTYLIEMHNRFCALDNTPQRLDDATKVEAIRNGIDHLRYRDLLRAAYVKQSEAGADAAPITYEQFREQLTIFEEGLRNEQATLGESGKAETNIALYTGPVTLQKSTIKTASQEKGVRRQQYTQHGHGKEKKEAHVRAARPNVKQDAPPLKCQNCGRGGHRARDCRNARATCTYCSKGGHLEEFCREKRKDEKSQNGGGRNDSRHQAHTAEVQVRYDDEDEYSAPEHGYVVDIEQHSALMLAHWCPDGDEWKKVAKDEEVIIDSGASIHIFKHPDAAKYLVDKQGLSPVDKHRRITVCGIGGVNLEATHHGNIPGLGKCVVVPKATHNLLSVNQMRTSRFSLDTRAAR